MPVCHPPAGEGVITVFAFQPILIFQFYFGLRRPPDFGDSHFCLPSRFGTLPTGQQALSLPFNSAFTQMGQA